jgi:hypothetical protein
LSGFAFFLGLRGGGLGMETFAFVCSEEGVESVE